MNPELIGKIPDYVPTAATIRDVVEHFGELTPQQLVLEIAHLRYELGQETVELIKASHRVEDPKLQHELEMLISLVALSDVPNVTSVLEMEPEKLRTMLELVQRFKDKISHAINTTSRTN